MPRPKGSKNALPRKHTFEAGLRPNVYAALCAQAEREGMSVWGLLEAYVVHGLRTDGIEVDQ